MEAAHPDLITLDIHMPELRGMDSYKLFRKIRKERPRVEFVVISGATYFQNRTDFLKRGERSVSLPSRSTFTGCWAICARFSPSSSGTSFL
jgi:CheY-like chemotaxis protein